MRINAVVGVVWQADIAIATCGASVNIMAVMIKMLKAKNHNRSISAAITRCANVCQS